jgi:Tfp pilus assembly protein PilF
LAFAVAGLASLPLRPAPGPTANGTGLFQPRIAVAVAEGESDADTSRLRDDLVDALAEFDEIAVVEQPADLREPWGAYVLSVRLTRRDGAPVAQARLAVASGGRVVWAREFAFGPDESGLSPARRIAARVAQPYGVVLADLRTMGGREPEIRCLVDTFDYWRRPSREAHLQARECLAAAVERAPRSALAQAHLSRITLEEARVGYNPGPDPIGRAWAQAREAVALRPESARANQALMQALFLKGDVDGALESGRRAVELSPGDADVRASFASRLVQAGRFEEGAAQMSRAVAASPSPPAWYQFPLFVAAVMTGDEAAARTAAARIDPSEFAMGHLARALAAKHAGNVDEARKEMAAFLERRPEMRRELRRELAQRLRHGPTVARFESELAALMPDEARGGRPPG